MRSMWLRLLVSFSFSLFSISALAQNAPNQINPNTQIRWPRPDCNSGVYSPGGNTCVAPGTAANAAGLQCQTQFNLDGSTFGGSTQCYDNAADVMYNHMVSGKGPPVDVTHKDFGVAAGCPAADKKGNTDMTCNIQAAITFAHLAAQLNTVPSPPAIYIPHGTYKLCGTLNFAQGDRVYGDGIDITDLKMCPGSQTAITIAAAGQPQFGFYRSETMLDNLTIEGAGNQTTGTMIENFIFHVYMRNVKMYNHGGRGLVNMKNAEAGHFENMPLVNIRWPVVNIQANENYFDKVDILTPGATAANYCYNLNCTNGVPLASGNWYPDHHSSVWLLGDNITFEHSSLKSLPFLQGICSSGQVGRFAHLYFEGFDSRYPLLEAGFHAGCYENNNSGLALAAATNTTTSIQIADTSWVSQFVNENALVAAQAAAMNPVTYDLVCGDVQPGSATPCVSGPAGVQQGQFERISVGAWGPDGKGYTVKRCLAGSTISCTANTSGPVWPATAKIYQVIFSQVGIPHLEDSHSNVASRGNTGTLTAMCNDQVVGQQCGEIIVGPVLDGVEITVPGQPNGFSNPSFFSLRSNINVENMFMSGWPGSGWAANTYVSGTTKVFTGGLVNCKQGMTSTGQYNAASAPLLPFNGNLAPANLGCGYYVFAQYPNGAYAYAAIANPMLGVFATPSATSTFSTLMRDVVTYSASGQPSPGGKQYWDGYCLYDQTASTLAGTAGTATRHCFWGGPDNTVAGSTAAETFDTSSNGGTSWTTAWKITADATGHPTLYAGNRYFIIASTQSNFNPFLVTSFGPTGLTGLNMPGISGNGGAISIVGRYANNDTRDALSVYANDGTSLAFQVAHNGSAFLGGLPVPKINGTITPGHLASWLNNTTLQDGGGAITALTTGSITPAAVTPSICSDQTFTLTGATTSSSFLTVKPPAALGNVNVMAINNGANSVLLHFCNVSTASVTPPAGAYIVPTIN